MAFAGRLIQDLVVLREEEEYWGISALGVDYQVLEAHQELALFFLKQNRQRVNLVHLRPLQQQLKK